MPSRQTSKPTFPIESFPSPSSLEKTHEKYHSPLRRFRHSVLPVRLRKLIREKRLLRELLSGKG
jgi:hypothetical protein